MKLTCRSIHEGLLKLTPTIADPTINTKIQEKNAIYGRINSIKGLINSIYGRINSIYGSINSIDKIVLS